MKPNLAPFKSLSTREQSLDMLRDALLSGELKPGQAAAQRIPRGHIATAGDRIAEDRAQPR